MKGNGRVQSNMCMRRSNFLIHATFLWEGHTFLFVLLKELPTYRVKNIDYCIKETKGNTHKAKGNGRGGFKVICAKLREMGGEGSK
jgi:hypothetical protein